jgi:hypothetical protein
MKKNDQNRIYGITSKVTAIQKAKFIQEAKKQNLSLSEWMCGTLDMSINAYEDINKITEVKQLQEDNAEKDKQIKSLCSKLEINKLFLDLKRKKNLHQDKTIMELEDEIKKLQRKLGYYRNAV